VLELVVASLGGAGVRRRCRAGGARVAQGPPRLGLAVDRLGDGPLGGMAARTGVTRGTGRRRVRRLGRPVRVQPGGVGRDHPGRGRDCTDRGRWPARRQGSGRHVRRPGLRQPCGEVHRPSRGRRPQGRRRGRGHRGDPAPARDHL
ncbi:MAG: hypothetical protein AVDCRST_MAG29-611, partial [uncultured Nocardioidaceae bacterium]